MPHSLSLRDATRAIRDRTLSPVELVDAYLARIEEHDAELNSFEVVLADRARDQAVACADSIARGADLGPLAGIPFAVKDIVAVAGQRMVAGSRAMGHVMSTRDASLVTTLHRAGALLLGTTKTFELALASSEAEVDADFNGPRNPWATNRTAGGSSSGPAVAVAANLVPFAIGTDTGGSVRIPAAFCGIVGMKPTFGSMSRRGILPLSWSLDTPGILTRTNDDNEIVHAAFPAGSPDVPAPQMEGLRVGVVTTGREHVDRFAPELDDVLNDASELLAASGCLLRAVNLPLVGAWQQALSTIVTFEGSRSFAGMLETVPDLIGAPVRERLESGGSMPEQRYFEAIRWQQACTERLRKEMADLDVLLLPSVPFVAPEIGTVLEQGSRDHAFFTRPFNLAGLPALSLPARRSAEELPLGLQVVARPGAEVVAYAVGRCLEDGFGPFPPWQGRDP